MPTLTVVIATLNRPAILRQTLNRLRRQRGAGPFEVIVASDAAEQEVDTVRSLVAESDLSCRHVVAQTPGVSAARNCGWRAAGTDLVLFIGDDMLPESNLVAQHRLSHESNPTAEVAVVGHVRWARQLRVTAFMRWLEHGMQFDYPSMKRSGAKWWHLYAANASLKRERLALVDGFDEGFRFGYEELELAKRLNEHGLVVLYNPQAIVEHLHPTDIEGWKRRMRLVASSEKQFNAKHPDTDPYFHKLFSHAAELPPARGRLAHLAAFVPRRFPLLGPRVWYSADAFFAQQLAPAFLQASNEVKRETTP